MSRSVQVLVSLPQVKDSISSAYVIDRMALLQSLNENHFRTFKDLAECVQKRSVRLLRDPALKLNSVTIIFVMTLYHQPKQQKENDGVPLGQKATAVSNSGKLTSSKLPSVSEGRQQQG